jgi:hypothetical protein
MTDNLKAIACPQCAGKAAQVIYAERRVRKGWYCPACRHFTPAVLRERRIEN